MTENDYRQHFEFFKKNHDGRFDLNESECIPRLNDDTSNHSFCPIYLYHTGWAARCLMNSRPSQHHDFGGLVYFTGIASAICPIKFYDIRVPYIPLPGVATGHADLTKLPFKDGELKSVSCMHVIEHIGLGRYGDTIDIQGDLKAAKELSRVLAPGGQLLFVAPLIGKPKIEFNAHRVYSYDQIIGMFPGLTLKEFTLVEIPHYIPMADPNRARKLTGEGAGCFWFQKPEKNEECLTSLG